MGRREEGRVGGREGGRDGEWERGRVGERDQRVGGLRLSYEMTPVSLYPRLQALLDAKKSKSLFER